MSGHDQPTYVALTQKMLVIRPVCAGDSRYVSDELSKVDVVEMAELCSLCPLYEACAEYAKKSRPAAGFWAGVKYPRPWGRPRMEP